MIKIRYYVISTMTFIIFSSATNAALIPYEIYFTARQVTNVGQVDTSDFGFPTPGSPDLYFAMGIASAPSPASFYTFQTFYDLTPVTIAPNGDWNFSNETLSTTIYSDTGPPFVYLYFLLMDEDSSVGDLDDSLGDHWTVVSTSGSSTVANNNSAPFLASDVIADAEGNGWASNYSLEYSVIYNAGPAIVPVPSAVWLMGSGLLGLIGIARRKPAQQHRTRCGEHRPFIDRHVQIHKDLLVDTLRKMPINTDSNSNTYNGRHTNRGINL